MENRETINKAPAGRKENTKQYNSQTLCYDLDSDWDAQYDEIKRSYYEYIKRMKEFIISRDLKSAHP